MYKPLTYHTDLGDVEVIEHEGKLHLFHLILPNRDFVGHAVSDDGLSWKAAAPAIRTGDPGTYDDDMIRTVSVTCHNDQYYMLYTATSRRFMENGMSEGGRVERFGVAVSKDLMKWEKRDEVPFVEADPTYYENTFGYGRNVSFRDPKPFYENGQYYCVVDARENNGPFLRRGCVALLTSKDLIRWNAQAPLYAPRSFFDIECPQIFKIGSYYYLLGSIIEDKSQRYWISEQVLGPYRTPTNNIIMPPNSHYAARIVVFNGEHVFCCWNESVEDGMSPYNLITNFGEKIRYVPSPLLIVQTNDGALRLAPYKKAWGKYKQGASEAVTWIAGSSLSGNAYSNFDISTQRLAVVSGMDGVLSDREYDDFLLEGTLILKGTRGGISFHLQDDSTGYFIELNPAQLRVRLIQHVPGQRNDKKAWFHYEVKQETAMELVNRDETGFPFMLRVVAGEIEFSLDGYVLLSTVSTALTKGKVGAFVESGEINTHNFQITRMNRPYNI